VYLSWEVWSKIHQEIPNCVYAEDVPPLAFSNSILLRYWPSEAVSFEIGAVFKLMKIRHSCYQGLEFSFMSI